MKTVTTLDYVLQKIEAVEGKTISLASIARKTTVSTPALSRIRNGLTSQFDLRVMDKIINSYPSAGIVPADFFLSQKE